MESVMAKPSNSQAKWGYIRGTRVKAAPLAFIIGTLLAIVTAAIRVAFNPPGEYRWAAVVIFAVCMAAPLIGLAWVLLVDRSTLPGATAHPELAVEHRWHTQAATNAFLTTVTVAGIGAALTSGTVSHVLVGIVLFEFLVYGVSYLWAKHR
ncbi:hypothetical protein ACU20_03215 [Actinobaculum suis]|nr:hypothetical protein ACU20_03215 [Actinobaculum suis]